MDAGTRTDEIAEQQAAASLDGRLRRGVRSRDAIVSALFELVGSGILQPTAQQVADRAGVGIRSVFRHFSEMESLYAALDARLEADVTRLLQGFEPAGTLDHRVQSLVRQRTSLFERIAAYKRSGNLVRWRSRFLQERHARMQRALRADVLAWLPELARAPVEVVHGVDLVLSFEAWDRMRGDRGLAPGAAASVTERAIRALLRDVGLEAAPGRRSRADGQRGTRAGRARVLRSAPAVSGRRSGRSRGRRPGAEP